MYHLEGFEWTKNAKRHYVKDPIDGGSVLRNESRDLIFDWCKENCKGSYWIGMGFGMFETDNDATLFILTWG